MEDNSKGLTDREYTYLYKLICKDMDGQICLLDEEIIEKEKLVKKLFKLTEVD